jgi:hypothetical protein
VQTGALRTARGLARSELMTWFTPRGLLDTTFEVGIILKGLDGLLELAGIRTCRLNLLG